VRINKFAAVMKLRYSGRAMSTEIQRHLFTVHDYHRMGSAGILGPEDRVELIYGEVVRMSPIGNPHNAACARALRAFVRAAGDDAIVLGQGAVRLNLYNEPQPDIALLKPRDDFYNKAHPGPADIFLLVEIAASSLRFDLQVKGKMYAEMGVAEYWVADLNQETVFAYSDPHEKAYRVMRQFQRGETLAPVLLPTCMIPVDSLLA
jgi:Uma2 family endonuclease